MREFSRLIATFFIWASFTVMMTSSNSPLNNLSVGGSGMVLAIAILACAAGGSTLAIWISGAKISHEENTVKAKRAHNRVGRFVDTLSDDEVAELRAHLMADDGEITSLENLLSSRETERLRRG